jgi:hypothetical protein
MYFSANLTELVNEVDQRIEAIANHLTHYGKNEQNVVKNHKFLINIPSYLIPKDKF